LIAINQSSAVVLRDHEAEVAFLSDQRIVVIGALAHILSRKMTIPAKQAEDAPSA